MYNTTMILTTLFLLFISILGSAVSIQCPEKGSKPLLRLSPAGRVEPGSRLRAECTHLLSPEPQQTAQITWALYKKEWGHLQYTLLPPAERKIEVFTDPLCGNVSYSRLTVTVTERLHKATLACFTRDTTSHPQKCGYSDFNCVQSPSIMVFVNPLPSHCKVPFAAIAGLLGGWLLLFVPILVGILWMLTRKVAASSEALVEDEQMVFEL